MGKVALYFSSKGGASILKKKKWNSKQVAVVLFVAVVVALILNTVVSIYQIYRLPKGDVEITGSIVDNRYNNYISESNLLHTTGDFVRIGDKLYYNYDGSYANYGLYEISSDGARRIQWDGYGPWAFLIGHDIQLYPIQEYNGKLLMNTFLDSSYYVYNHETMQWDLAQGRIQSYNEEAQTFEELVLFDGVSDIAYLTYQETSFGVVYRSNALTDLWIYTESDGSERVAADDVCSFYAVGEQIYYLTSAAKNDPYVLHMFDWGTKTDTVVCEWRDYANLTNFIIEDESLIFVATHLTQETRSLYILDLSDSQSKEKAIYTVDVGNSSSAYISSTNVWNGTVYLCTEKGLIACDLDTGSHRILSEKNAYTCYIVDDTWVYFEEADSNYLWRVPQSGGDAELVLGIS